MAAVMDLEGKVAFVSGAAAGLGAAIADRLADAGAFVVRHSGRTGPTGGDLGDSQVAASMLSHSHRAWSR